MESLYTSACDVHRRRNPSRSSLTGSPAGMRRQHELMHPKAESSSASASNQKQHDHRHGHNSACNRAALPKPPPLARHKVTKPPNFVVAAASTTNRTTSINGSYSIRNCDTVTTAHETMGSFTASRRSCNTAVSRSGFRGSQRLDMHDDQPVIIPTSLEEQQGVEIFSPRLVQKSTNSPGYRSDDRSEDSGSEDDITDTSSISTALSTLATYDPQQQIVHITGIQKAVQNYEICQAASSESATTEDDDAFIPPGSLLDAATLSTEDDDYDEKLHKMSDQTRQFQQWMGMGTHNNAKDEQTLDSVPRSWRLKPAKLAIPASQQGIQRQANNRGLINSLGSRRSLLRLGEINEQGSKIVGAPDRSNSQRSTTKEFLESAERLEKQKRAEAEKDKNSSRASSVSLLSQMSSALKMVGDTLYSCNGSWQ
mmetsp:Transcript_7441/g.15538  ORF Transcript_7441/g.15538 Transcript_7441/m.15538 type:complete len:425 (+) Transcript_7441:140-1414(+)